MLFNHTRKPVVICEKAELRGNILNALYLTKKVICKREGVESLTREDGLNEKARLGHTKLSIFKYLDGFEDDFNLDSAWLNKIYELANEDPQKSKEIFHQVLPKYSRFTTITRNDARGLRSDLRLFIHCCWASRFLLLPIFFTDLPKRKHGKNGSMEEYADDAYPEILRIIRSPFFKQLECEIDITKHMSEASMPNFKWYAHKYVRACAAWDVEDITNDLLKEITSKSPTGVPRTVDWYFAIHASLPNRVQFDTGNVFVRSGVTGIKGKLSTKNFNPKEIEQHPAILAWIVDINSYINELREKGIKTYDKYQSAIRRAMQILIVSGKPIPEPKDIKRHHTKIIVKGLGVNVKASTHQELLYKLYSFFEYIAMNYKNFTIPISKQLDIPIVPRHKGTVKQLLPEDSFSSYLSYLYGVAEWIWYMNHHNPNKDSVISKERVTNRTIKTSDTGFMPIFRCNHKYYPIEEIPKRIVSLFRTRQNIKCQLKSHTFLPHYIHLSIVMAETGIRLIALRFLNEETYAQNVNREHFIDYSYLITQLWVNSDKSHDAWEADVVESVIGILDRQLFWKRTFLTGKDVPIYYDSHEETSFEMIKPLFAQVNSYLEINPSFSVVSDKSYRKAFKLILIGFSYTYSKSSENNIPPIKIDHDKNLDENIQHLKGYVDENKKPITPHSMRSQFVSEHITVLPPSILQRVTGHITEAQVIYYAQINTKYLDTQKAGQEAEFKDFIAPMMVDAKSKQSALQQAFSRNATIAMNDFGAISFTNSHSTSPCSGMQIIKKKQEELDVSTDSSFTIVDQLAFNSTHICPFNNDCPSDITGKSINGELPYAGCPYSIKTVDHIPAISAKIRLLTDKAAEHDDTINEAKENGESMDAYLNDISLKKFYADEISAWATSLTCLDSMVNSLSKKDKWLVGKPKFIQDKLTKLKSSNELTNTLIRIEEAISFHEFLTPQLKAKVTQLRNKVLAQTGQFQALMDEVPTGRDLLSEFKGIIKSICDVTGVSINDLPNELKRIEKNTQDTLKNNLNLTLKPPGENNA
ncbi:hypothetical protein A165_09350 [Vibrio tasmaniensis ZS-17]|uniref:hypothetical protein n=1 Tax=Vibrio tasmaniensis TaxID=212663 RepID=UPI0003059C40|nr:hypothetical protein [Vibrio tasmaniensis]OED65656.1 hypothetical protein A165_09350 [Vibrio tasmaniensis ZS-17]